MVPLLNIIIAYIGQAHVAHRAIEPSASYSSTVAPRTCASTTRVLCCGAAIERNFVMLVNRRRDSVCCLLDGFGKKYFLQILQILIEFETYTHLKKHYASQK